MRIGIFGGTGPAGSGLAARLASIGYPTVIGSRSKERAAEKVDELLAAWPQLAGMLEAGDNASAAECDMVVIATPWDSAAGTAQENADALNGKIVISMANALVRVNKEFQPLVPPRGSVAAHVQAAVPRSRVVAAFHHLPATELGHIDEPIDSDVLDLRRRCIRSARGQRDRREVSGLPPPRCGRALQCHGHRGVHRRAAPTQRPLQDAGCAEADGNQKRPSRCCARVMQLYDTARRAIVAFEPNDHVLMYTCGITPYDATHLGHAATFIAYDVLQRRLIDKGHTVRCIRNVTDVDDPLFAKARELGIHYLDLAAGEEARFERDMEALNALPVAAAPRASSAIPDIRGFIGMVLDRGFAYESGGSVYFDVSKFGSFGSLSHYSDEEMLVLAKERGGNIDDPNKRSPLDFVLWHPSASDEPSWDTMWGAGRPGWHIECSALALRELGTTIDLHGGGADLIFPHHECERAQSEAATGEPFVKHWMHTALIHKDGEKMSKSLGNLVFVDQLRETWDPRAIRLAIIEHHYRTEWEWDEDLMPRNAARLDAWNERAGSNPDLLDEVRGRLDDDLDTPGAIAAIDDAARRGAGVAEAAALLGVDLD